MQTNCDVLDMAMPETGMDDKHQLIEMTVQIVSAYVGHNTIPAQDVVQLIRRVHQALAETQTGVEKGGEQTREPAIAVRKSVTPDFLICLEDGKKFKSLKRHLRSHYNLSPEQYREKWGLPPDYPMVAPNYAQARSKLAKKMGLGQSSSRPKRSGR